jgi:hypothetical protein
MGALSYIQKRCIHTYSHTYTYTHIHTHKHSGYQPHGDAYGGFELHTEAMHTYIYIYTYIHTQILRPSTPWRCLWRL